MAKDRKAADAQLIGNPARISGCCGDCSAGTGSRPSVTGSVIADPTDAKGTRGSKERLGRRSRVGGSVMPQDDQLIGASRGTFVVRVKNPPVGSEKVHLTHSGSSGSDNMLPI